MKEFGSYDLDAYGRLGYRPAAPPFPKLDDVWERLQAAESTISEFDRALSAFPVPGTLGSLFGRSDAVHSSTAEGCTTTFGDLLEFQSGLKQAPDPEDARTVAAASDAFNTLSQKKGDPLTAAKSIHRRLFPGKDSGKLKTIPNGVADQDRPGGYFLYTHPDRLQETLAAWKLLTMDSAKRPELVRQALAHWMFEHIHPFPDGNGRIGRLLVPLAMSWKGATQNACAFLGEGVRQNKGLYVEGLKAARSTGDFARWTRTFLALAEQTARANQNRLSKLAGLMAGWQKATAKFRAHSLVHPLVPWALTHPKFTVKDAQAGIGTGSFASVNEAVARLEELGLVEVAGQRSRDRLFVAKAVIELFEP
ncbi:MAG: Fic family protein [Alphaproteobacteria bacterium]|nr:Fic family protein [Alphaproteobacteria bacterium]